jgi:hypothetical protein
MHALSRSVYLGPWNVQAAWPAWQTMDPFLTGHWNLKAEFESWTVEFDFSFFFLYSLRLKCIEAGPHLHWNLKAEIDLKMVFIFVYLSTFTAHYPRVSSKRLYAF